MKRLINLFLMAVTLLLLPACNDDPDFIKNAPPASGNVDEDDDSTIGDETEEGVDQNFQIYLCFGQSNMEGFASGSYNGIEEQDKTVDERFQMMAVVSDGWDREAGHWYAAVPPLCRYNTGLCPADYFGRTMVEKLSETNPDVKIGVIVVAIGGAGIKAFHKTKYYEYYSDPQNAGWQQSLMDIYGGYPYGKLVEMAKAAQKQGVIKGILMHQGETDGCGEEWRGYVADIYNNLISDLSLTASETPLLVGELLNDGQGHGNGVYKNADLLKISELVPNTYVVSSEGCSVVDASIDPDDEGNNRYLHFSSEGYRELGRHYAETMLAVLEGQQPEEPAKPIVPVEELFNFDSEYFDIAVGMDDASASWNPETKELQTAQYGVFGWHYGDKYADISSYKYLVAELQEAQNTGAGLCIYSDSDITGCSYISNFSEGENGGKRVVIDLSNGLNANVNNNGQVIPIDLTSVKIIGIWSYGSSVIKFDKIYLTNERPTDVDEPTTDDLFVFEEGKFNPKLSGSATFDFDTMTLSGAGGWGVSGWEYGSAVNIKGLGYLVVKLSEINGVNPNLILGNTNVWGEAYQASGATQASDGYWYSVVDLSEDLKSNVNDDKDYSVGTIYLDQIKLIGIQTGGSATDITYKIEGVYLSDTNPLEQ